MLIKYDYFKKWPQISFDWLDDYFPARSIFSNVNINKYFDTDGNLIVNIPLPGLDKQDISITVDNEIIGVTGKNDTYSYIYTFTIDTDKYSIPEDSKLDKGILTLVFNKRDKSLNKQEIKIS